MRRFSPLVNTALATAVALATMVACAAAASAHVGQIANNCAGTSIHIRWHYSSNDSAGSWSATTSFACPGPVSMGPQAMEGNLQVAPGHGLHLRAGYDFTIPGDNNAVTVRFTNPEVTFANVTCASGATPTTSTITVPMPTRGYTSTNGGNWYPTGNQSGSRVYQGSIKVPNVCNGGAVSFKNGGTFTATIS